MNRVYNPLNYVTVCSIWSVSWGCVICWSDVRFCSYFCYFLKCSCSASISWALRGTRCRLDIAYQTYQTGFLSWYRRSVYLTHISSHFTCIENTLVTCHRTCVMIAINLFPIPSIAISSRSFRFWIFTCTIPLHFPSVTCLWTRRPPVPWRPHSVDSQYVYCERNSFYIYTVFSIFIQ